MTVFRYNARALTDGARTIEGIRKAEGKRMMLRPGGAVVAADGAFPGSGLTPWSCRRLVLIVGTIFLALSILQGPVVVQASSCVIEIQISSVPIIVPPVASSVALTEAVTVVDETYQPQVFAAGFDIGPRLGVKREQCFGECAFFRYEKRRIDMDRLSRRDYRHGMRLRESVWQVMQPQAAAEHVGRRPAVVTDLEAKYQFDRSIGWASRVESSASIFAVDPSSRLVRESHVGAFNGSGGVQLPPVDHTLKDHCADLEKADNNKKAGEDFDRPLYAYLAISVACLCLQFWGAFLCGRDRDVNRWGWEFGGLLIAVGWIALGSTLGAYVFGSAGAFWRFGWLWTVSEEREKEDRFQHCMAPQQPARTSEMPFYKRLPSGGLLFYDLVRRQEFSDRPDVIGEAGFHRGRDAEGLMHAAEVVPRHEHGDGCFQVVELFAKPVGQAGESAHLHTDRPDAHPFGQEREYLHGIVNGRGVAAERVLAGLGEPRAAVVAAKALGAGASCSGFDGGSVLALQAGHGRPLEKRAGEADNQEAESRGLNPLGLVRPSWCYKHRDGRFASRTSIVRGCDRAGHAERSIFRTTRLAHYPFPMGVYGIGRLVI